MTRSRLDVTSKLHKQVTRFAKKNKIEMKVAASKIVTAGLKSVNV